MDTCCNKCGLYDVCHPQQNDKKRGAKIKFNDPIHEAWRLSSRDRYKKQKNKTLGDEK